MKFTGQGLKTSSWMCNFLPIVSISISDLICIPLKTIFGSDRMQKNNDIVQIYFFKHVQQIPICASVKRSPSPQLTKGNRNA